MMAGFKFRLVALFYIVSLDFCYSWSNVPVKSPRRRQLNEKLVTFSAAAIVALVSPNVDQFHLEVPPANAIDSTLSLDEEKLRKSLKPATPERPQIVLPSSVSNIPIEKQPIVEGIVVFWTKFAFV